MWQRCVCNRKQQQNKTTNRQQQQKKVGTILGTVDFSVGIRIDDKLFPPLLLISSTQLLPSAGLYVYTNWPALLSYYKQRLPTGQDQNLMLCLLLNAAFTVLAKESQENVTVTLDSMANCLNNEGQLILPFLSGSIYMRYSPGEHNLTESSDLSCQIYITNVPTGMHISIEIFAESTDCGFAMTATDYTNFGEVTYCYVTAREDMQTSRKWIMSSNLVQLYVQIKRLTTPFVLHLQFKAVQPSYDLQVHYDSPKQGK